MYFKLVFGCCAIAVLATLAPAALVTNGQLVLGEYGGTTGNGLLDLTVDRISFDVDAGGIGASVNFDALIAEAAGTDLNGDGLTTQSDWQVNLYTASGTTPLARFYSFQPGHNFTFFSSGPYIAAVGVSFDDSAPFLGYQHDAIPSTTLRGHYDWQLTMTPTSGEISNVSVLANINVPEPASAALVASGAAALLLGRRRVARSRNVG
jgi:hypothetical protein